MRPKIIVELEEKSEGNAIQENKDTESVFKY